MNWIKKIFTKNKKSQDKDKPKVKQLEISSETINTNKCICDLNGDGEEIGGWCPKHRTDWI